MMIIGFLLFLLTTVQIYGFTSLGWKVGFQAFKTRRQKYWNDEKFIVPSLIKPYMISTLKENEEFSSLVGFNETSYQYFKGIEDIVVVKDYTSNTKRRFFQPLALQNADRQEKLSWLQQKKLSEEVLKNAIASNETDIRPYFEEYETFTVLEKSEILQSNNDFFQAWNERDIESMRSLWLISNETLCIKAGDEIVVTGYDNIINMWGETLLNSPKSKQMKLKSVRMEYMGEIAIVSNLVDVYHSNPEKQSYSSKKKLKSKEINPAYVTNVFVKSLESNRYFLYSHVCSVYPNHNVKSLRRLRETYMDPSRKRKPKKKSAQSSIIQMFGGGGGANNVFGVGDDDDDDDDENNQQNEDENDENDSDDDDDDDDENNSDSDSDDDDNSNNSDDDSDNDSGISIVRLDDSTGDSEEDAKSAIRKELKNEMANRISEALKQAITEAYGKKGQSVNANVVVLKSELGSSATTAEKLAAIRKAMGESKNGKIIQLSNLFQNSERNSNNNNNDDDDDDDDDDDNDNDDDDDDDDDENNERAKEVASKALIAVRWLHSRNRLTLEEKKLLTSDVIKNVSDGNFSRVEVAFSLLIGNGRPDEGASESIPLDMSLIDDEDMEEFENACKNIVRTYKTINSER